MRVPPPFDENKSEESIAGRGQPPLPAGGSEAMVERLVRHLSFEVEAEFDAVAACLTAVAGKQQMQRRRETQAMLAILEEMRVEVRVNLSKPEFPWFWLRGRDPVRQMLFADVRYQAIVQARTRSRLLRPGSKRRTAA